LTLPKHTHPHCPQQCLNMLSPADTKPLRTLIEEQFDAVKHYTESKAALLPLEYCDW
jgi:hypothetical protein